MDEGAVCVANITRAGRIRRGVMGAVVLVATAATYLSVMHGFVPTSELIFAAMPVLSFAPAAFGWLCILQAMEKT